MLMSAMFVSAQEAMLWTDKDDYNPLETVYFSGINFEPNTNVDIYIEAPDGTQDSVSITTDSSGTFTNVPWVLDGNMAMQGDYDACAGDGINSACTAFTDTGCCVKNVYSYCENNQFKVRGEYNSNCKKKLRITLYNDNNPPYGDTPLLCQATSSNTVEWIACTSSQCNVQNPVVKLEKYVCFFCWCNWVIIEDPQGDDFWTPPEVSARDCCTTSTSSTSTTTPPTTTPTTQPPNGEIPEFNMTSAIALVSLLLAGYAVMRGSAKK
jgi:hypothetical protein